MSIVLCFRSDHVRSSFIRLLVCFCIVLFPTLSYSQNLTVKPDVARGGVSYVTPRTDVARGGVSDVFVESLMLDYGRDGELNIAQLQTLLTTLNQKYGFLANDHPSEATRSKIALPIVSDAISKNVDANCYTNLPLTTSNLTDPSTRKCILVKCLTAEDVFALYNIPLSGSLNHSSLLLISPALVYQAQHTVCMNAKVMEIPGKAPSIAQVWGYSFLLVTIINLCSLVGVAVVPFMRRDFYHRMLMFLVALAVGTLCGSSLLFLIPDAFGLFEIEEIKDTYVFKASTVIGGIYLFFLIERFLKMIIDFKQKRKSESDFKHHQEAAGAMCSLRTIRHLYPEQDHKQQQPPLVLASGDSQPVCQVILRRNDGDVTGDDGIENMSLVVVPDQTKPVQPPKQEPDRNGTAAHAPDQVNSKRTIAPVAWMIIFGDGLHNFIDGLSIGAAFSDNILTGVSISVAVICEEFPHELGDFAILLKSGMSVKKALLFNFMSACMCYAGVAVGIILGELTAASRWIFALAGGMFLYISLVDMMPEMNQATESEEGVNISKGAAFLLQNLGLLVGFGLMLVLSVYSKQIDFTT